MGQLTIHCEVGEREAGVVAQRQSLLHAGGIVCIEVEMYVPRFDRRSETFLAVRRGNDPDAWLESPGVVG